MNKKRMCRIVLLTLLTLLIMIFIFCMSAQDADRSTDTSRGFLSSVLGEVLEQILPRLTEKGMENDIRKYAHIFEFFCLGLSSCLLFFELYWRQRHLFGKAGLSALLFGLLYACSDEIHQLFVPGRSGKFSDVLVDMTGVAIAVVLVVSGKAVKDRKKHS